ncbi:hypothetical protein AAHC03_04763 [Spirometra sp. Aus1]
MRKYERLFHLAETKWRRHVTTYSGGYQRVKEGVGVTFTDFSQFLRLSYKRFGTDVSSNFNGLTRNEIRLLRTVPRDMVRLTPLLVAVALPATIAILPLFLAFPRLLLTRNFWTEAERRHFDVLQLRLRLLGPHADLTRQLTLLVSAPSSPSSSAPSQVYRSDVLQDHVSDPTSSKEEQFSEEHRLLCKNLDLISQSKTPSFEDVKRLIPVFDGPLNLDALDHHHITFLCGLHGLVRYRKPLPNSAVYRRPFADFLRSPANISRRRQQLQRLAQYVFAEDRHLATELDRDVLIPDRELVELCLLRGIDGHSLSVTDMSRQLQTWCSISLAASDTSHSFRLHLPYLLNFKRQLMSYEDLP